MPSPVAGTDLYLSGWFSGTNVVFGSHQLVQQGGNDAFTVKADVNGQPQWIRQVTRTIGSEAGRVAVDGAGDVFAAGSYVTNAQAGVVVLSSVASGQDGYLVKYSGDGDLRWVLPVAGTGADLAAAVSVGPGGDLSFRRVWRQNQRWRRIAIECRAEGPFRREIAVDPTSHTGDAVAL